MSKLKQQQDFWTLFEVPSSLTASDPESSAQNMDYDVNRQSVFKLKFKTWKLTTHVVAKKL